LTNGIQKNKLFKLISALYLNFHCFQIVLNVTKTVVFLSGSVICCSVTPRLRLVAVSVTLRLFECSTSYGYFHTAQ
jgi:hypothetical protein